MKSNSYTQTQRRSVVRRPKIVSKNKWKKMQSFFHNQEFSWEGSALIAHHVDSALVELNEKKNTYILIIISKKACYKSKRSIYPRDFIYWSSHSLISIWSSMIPFYAQVNDYILDCISNQLNRIQTRVIFQENFMFKIRNFFQTDLRLSQRQKKKQNKKKLYLFYSVDWRILKWKNSFRWRKWF